MKNKKIISDAVEHPNQPTTCPNCGGTGIAFNLALEPSKRSIGSGCFLSYIVFVLFLFIPVIGWILLFAMYSEKRKPVSVTYALCKNCGYNWRFAENKPKYKPSAFLIISIVLIAMFVICAVALILYFEKLGMI